MNWFATIVQGMAKPLKWWVVVAVWESGLRVRFGKNPKILEPGLHFRIPWVDRIYIQSVRRRTLVPLPVNARTLDGKNVTLTLAVHFSIADILALYNSLSTPESTIETAASAGVVAYVGSKLSDEFTVEGLTDAAAYNLDPTTWGLDHVTVSVVSLTLCRAYRILDGGYRQGTGLWNIDRDTGCEDGEHK